MLDLFERGIQARDDRLVGFDGRFRQPRAEIALAHAFGKVAEQRLHFLFVGAALLGGIILNLMPCVFPVLAMKAAALSAAAHGGVLFKGGAPLEALAKVEKRNPVVPVIANVLAAPVSDAEEIARLLVEQVTGQVRWRETVEWFAANNVTTLYELGSGKVLTGLARRIDKTVNGIAVNTPADIDAALAALLA